MLPSISAAEQALAAVEENPCWEAQSL